MTFGVGAGAEDAWFRGGAAATLQRAHEAFLSGRPAEAAEAIRATLSDPKIDSVQKDNALALLDKMFDAGKGKVSVDWKLPSGVDQLNLSVIRDVRGDSDHPRYRLQLWSALEAKGAIEQLRIVRFPNEVLLDIKGHVGEYEEEVDDGQASIFMATEHASTPPPPGLYLLEISARGQADTHGWFVLPPAASASGSVLSPAPRSTLSNGHPTLQWLPFRSPEFRTWEQRNCLARIFTDDGRWEMLFTDRIDGDTRHETIATGANKGDLLPGDYTASIRWQEVRRFGPLSLSRDATTNVPFSVR